MTNSPFMVRLSPQHLERLEEHRKSLGCRSLSEAMRCLIDGPEVGTTDLPLHLVAYGTTLESNKQHTKVGRIGPVDALTGEPIPERKPMQKTGKKK